MRIRLNEMVEVPVKSEASGKFPFPGGWQYFGFVKVDGKIVPIAMTEHSLFERYFVRREDKRDCQSRGVVFEQVSGQTRRRFICTNDRFPREVLVVNLSDITLNRAKHSAQSLIKNNSLLWVPRLRLIDRLFNLFK